MDTIIAYEQLAPLGIPYTREHLRRMERARAFPQRIWISTNRCGWRHSELAAWLEERSKIRGPGKRPPGKPWIPPSRKGQCKVATMGHNGGPPLDDGPKRRTRGQR